jgi:hypothetical protein
MKKRVISRGNESLNSTAATLLVESASVVVRPPLNITVAGVAASQAFVDGVLIAAKAGGYTKTDALRAMLLLGGQASGRLVEMTRAACKAAGFAAICTLVAGLESAHKVHCAQGGTL